MSVYLGTEKISVYTGGVIVKNSGQYVWEKYEVSPPYLSFIGNEDFTLKTANTTKNWDGTLEYSTDTSTWNTWDGTEISSAGSKLYLRGTGNTKITGNSSDYRFVFTGTNALKITCEGNIENLLDYTTVKSGGHPTMAENCYRYMFRDCTALTTAPALPATKLAGYCYRRMFSGCTSLTTAPALPATTLADYCYNNMFSSCTALTTAPALPATTLADHCYAGMFSVCTSLAETPALPETTLAVSCYESMFSGCTSLTTAPSLPATTLAGYCYRKMFSGCTSIKLSTTQTGEYQTEYRIPVSGDGTGLSTSLLDMFANTGGTFTGTPEINTTYYLVPPYLTFDGNEDFTLKTANTTKNWDGTLEYSTDTTTWNTWDGTEISSAGSKLYLRGTGNTKITGYSSDYRFVFTGTNALKIACRGNIENLLDYETVSAGGHPTMHVSCYRNIFRDCTALTTAPVLPATTLAGYCYRRMFSGCTSLTSAPTLPATTLTDYCYDYMFSGCTSLTSAPTLPATTLTDYCYNSMFYGCTALTAAPALPATTLAQSCYNSMFYGCTALTAAPALPATTLADKCYRSMFRVCTSLTTAPALPATTLAVECYSNMFNGCTALTIAPELPATTLANSCYQHMFEGCTALTTAPALPAATLADSCYYGMFDGCTSIKLSTTQTGEYQTVYRIPTSGTGTTASNALTDIFARTGGTFTGAPEINTTYYLSTSNTVV